MSAAWIPVTGFKECDIRGKLGTDITGEMAAALGRAVSTLSGAPTIVIGGDFRTSTPELMEALARGITASGSDVVSLGQVSTPAFYFARRHLGIQPGIMVTASHNPPVWNGFKLILGEYPITPAELDTLKHLLLAGQFASGQGNALTVDIKAPYAAWLARRFETLRHTFPRVIFDCGNGATGWIIQEVFDRLGQAAEMLFIEPDGTFPHRSPDIAKPDDLALLQDAVSARGAQFGIGFDGDGDRMGVVDNNGQRVSSDRLIAWLARELLQQQPGASIIYDLKMSNVVPETVHRYGGSALIEKSGHTFIKTAMLRHDALFGGEYSGHLFFRELGGGDDALFAALLTCTLVTNAGQPLSDLLADIPQYPSTPDIRVTYHGERQALIDTVAAAVQPDCQQLLRIDGVRAQYENGWALMRSSVTEPAFTFRFEGRTQAAMLAIAERFLASTGTIRDAVWAQIAR